MTTTTTTTTMTGAIHGRAVSGRVAVVSVCRVGHARRLSVQQRRLHRCVGRVGVAASRPDDARTHAGTGALGRMLFCNPRTMFCRTCAPGEYGCPCNNGMCQSALAAGARDAAPTRRTGGLSCSNNICDGAPATCTARGEVSCPCDNKEVRCAPTYVARRRRRRAASVIVRAAARRARRARARSARSRSLFVLIIDMSCARLPLSVAYVGRLRRAPVRRLSGRLCKQMRCILNGCVVVVVVVKSVKKPRSLPPARRRAPAAVA